MFIRFVWSNSEQLKLGEFTYNYDFIRLVDQKESLSMVKMEV